ncbi:FmdB family zinc ribbon protein [Ideonella sp. DXS29W]|uniref:FmdB family zinc ribbon protein n=1 Tax=Ideonella lacteola TaxID=2984193 RepID=A0ABU9BJP6_9BURK
MPIYAYRCAACGHSRDVLQKLSDAPLTQCPACGAEQFSKQITAAGFQLKGSGWYATDFRNNGGSSSTSGTAAAAAKSDGTASSGADSGSSSGGSESASSGGTPCGGSCACH